ncbi:MAG: excinuclease ABC subunit UvrC [Anaerolineae bacterium]|jgi:excinuclease ABC subunit C|nr:excinuclease ABC subunit UvrC [Anaerolineae bacterium]
MASYTPLPHIQEILDNLPSGPGVYQMIDPAGKIIYVGKAKNLRSRVRSYFQPSNMDSKVLRIRHDAADIQFILTGDELKALITEAELIRVHKPRYNILLKDDKRYPYIRVTTGDAFPTVEMTRRLDRHDGHRYFGPFTSAGGVRETLDVLRRAFPYLTCDREITGNDTRACLYYDIKLCGAPCIGAQTKEEYWENINGLMRVLSGHADSVLSDLRAQMEEASEALDFERAALLRDRIQVVAQISARQRLVADIDADQDVIAFAQEGSDAVVQMFLIRNGRLVGSEYFALEGAEDEAAGEIVSTFLTQFYQDATDIPREVIVPEHIDEARIIEQWLRDRRGGRKVKLTVPQRGNKRELVQLAAQTAVEKLGILRSQWASDTVKQETALRELQQALGLPNPPNRIECYDISTTQGTAIVASRVVFVQGVPRKSEYRRFNIQTVAHEGSDDYQSMREALTRRFRRYHDAQEQPTVSAPGKKDQAETWRLLPDLLIVDGGKGQLNVAVEVLQAVGLFGRVPVCGLAKQFEEIYLPGREKPVILPRRSEGMFLVQRVRDEAHRFAITSHRARRRRTGLASQLESVPGIGPARRKALLKAFDKDIEAIRAASVEQLAAVPGITRDIAENIKAALGG